MTAASSFPAIEELLPHRGAMRWVDRVVDASDHSVTVECTVRRGMPFVAEAGWPAWVGIELMAQAIGAWAGLRAREAGLPIRLGFLLGTRHYASEHSFFPVGARLRVKADEDLRTDDGLAVFNCTLSMDGQVSARARLTVFQPADVERYLEGLSS
jgi:predicted hotdog family 3-hydroxylacyl-ACP dehydratase